MKFGRKTALIFDLDDTLIPSSQFYAPAVASCLQDAPDRIEIFQEARRQVKADLPPLHTSARNRQLYFKRYLELLGDRRTSALALYESYEQKLSEMIRAWAVEHERVRCLELFRSRYELYVLTNENTRSQLAKIEALCPAGGMFQGILTSEEAGYEKPDLRFFQLLLKRFHLSVENCLYVGDSYDMDIVPAQKLGLDCVQTLEFAEPRGGSTRSGPTINQLSQLLDVL